MGIRLIIFDLDGVLIESREMHFETLNDALLSIDPKYVISKEEHLSTYDGMSTTKKLQLLTEKKGLPKELHEKIWRDKQDWTACYIFDKVTHDQQKHRLFADLHDQGYKIGVCSNSVRVNTRMMLYKLGLLQFVDYYYSNQDVQNTKPHPEMYMRCMLDAGVSPRETLIIEDSHIGREAAINSGAHLLGVKDPSEVTLQNVMNELTV